MRGLRIALVGVSMLALLSSAVAMGLLFTATSASAIGASEYACTAPNQAITDALTPITGARLTINNGKTTRNVELTFSADFNGASAFVTWTEDGASPALYTYGPSLIVDGGQVSGTLVNVAPGVAGGVHVFQAYVYGSQGSIAHYCAVAQERSS